MPKTKRMTRKWLINLMVKAIRPQNPHSLSNLCDPWKRFTTVDSCTGVRTVNEQHETAKDQFDKKPYGHALLCANPVRPHVIPFQLNTMLPPVPKAVEIAWLSFDFGSTSTESRREPNRSMI